MTDVTHKFHGRTLDGRKVIRVERFRSQTNGDALLMVTVEGDSSPLTHYIDGKFYSDSHHGRDIIRIDQPHPLDEPKPVATAPTPTPEPGPRVVKVDDVMILASSVRSVEKSAGKGSKSWVLFHGLPESEGVVLDCNPDDLAAALWPNAVVVEVGK